jgi:uncharacterized membrane protein YedE/YeeE
MKHWAAFGAGVSFALGLCLAGMTLPQKVIGFLDLAHWDPSLLFTMFGACVVSFMGWRLRARLAQPLIGGVFPAAAKPHLDARLVLGAALFGVGWGLAGYCPGPAIVSLGAGAGGAWVFFAAMVAGMGIFQLFERRTQAKAGSAAKAASSC